MNILIITPGYPYKNNPYYVFVKRIVDEWAKMGHHCYVIAPLSLVSIRHKGRTTRPYHYIDNSNGSIPVNVFSPKCITFGDFTVQGVSISQYIYSRTIYKVTSQINVKFDFIYAHFVRSAQIAYPYAKENNITLAYATGESVIKKIGKPCIKYSDADFRKIVKKVVAVSSRNKDLVIKLGLADENKCIVLPNGTDLSKFYKMDRKECRMKLGFSESDFIVICVGALIERKGQNRLLDAVKELNMNDIKLVFVGKGDLELNDDQIIFKAPVPNDELPCFLNAADVFCLPTLNEGCCNAVIEAMACGVPIISSNKEFNYDVLNEHNSILVDPLDIKAISGAIETLYSDKILRETLERQLIRDAQRLSINFRALSIINSITNVC